MKKDLLLMISLLLCASLLIGCGTASSAPADEPGPAEAPAAAAEPRPEDEPDLPPLPGTGMLGGWSVTDSPVISEEDRAVFEKAMEGFVGVDYKPEALLATQIVSGRNYAFFCRARAVVPDARPYFAVVTVYEDTSGNASIEDIRAMTPDGRADENAGAAGALLGGWSVPESQDGGLAAFEKAVGPLLGVEYEPVLVTGEQVVSGMNYCVLCRVSAVSPEAVPGYCFVTVNRDTDGNAVLLDVRAVGD